MKFSWRAVLCAVVMVGATGAFKACNSDGPTSGGEDPPVTADDRIETTATGTSALTVLTNDTKLDNPPLTYTIEDSPSVGSASFNADDTVALTLPSGFKGLTKFRYKVTNSKGGFSISSVAVFVDVPAYRALFAAKTGTAGNYEIYVSDFNSSTKISNAANGNLRLQNMWKSKTGSLIAYERADPSNVGSTSELFFVKPTSSPSSPVKFPLALNRAFISGAPVVMSDDGRYIAYATNPSTGSGGAPTNLYVLDSENSTSPTPVSASAGAATGFTQWIGNGPTLYFVAPQGSSGHALLRANVGSFDAPQRISPVYQSADQDTAVLIAPEGTRVLVVGTHGAQAGAFFIDPVNAGIERRLTTDMPAGAVIDGFRTDQDVSKLVYLWHVANNTTPRLSVIDIDANATPQTVPVGNNVLALADLRPDSLAVLITRGTGGAGTDGALYEVMLDGSGESLITSNVTGGVYADGDRVYLYSRTLAPSVLQRANFERTPDPLVRSSTPAGALFVSPIFQPTAAILEDPTSGVVLVNAAAPGKTLKFTDMAIGLGSTDSSTLLPTIIDKAP
jgi:Big-like domain-containing protein